MRLTLHTDYGLRILVYLASAPGRVVTTVEIGRAYDISKNHLVRVAQSLRSGGFIELTPGRTGGLTLAQPPAKIRIGQVVRTLEPELRMVECFDAATNTCPIAPRCGLRGPIAEALEAFLASLDRHTLADVVSRSGPSLTSFFLPAEALTRKRPPTAATTAARSSSASAAKRSKTKGKVPALTTTAKGISRRRQSA